jgi:hypothetical protein
MLVFQCACWFRATGASTTTTRHPDDPQIVRAAVGAAALYDDAGTERSLCTGR